MNRWILLLCGILAGCQYSHKQEADDMVCQTIDMAAVFDREPTEIKLDEWAKNVRFIPLETTDPVLLTGYIPQIVDYQDKLEEGGRYLIGYEVQENDENPVIILAER
ncbi:hypothetical protein [uncultured Parabacteroides sp.]|uniref:hypothetical protein n=1 Tax=uncultured Parabacteroides sp. TaxID=512312 RepID=UPI00262A0560|nr:hypothetical protein [uncultured Parabacteroides sp.]